MKSAPTLYERTRDQALVIPEALFELSDARVLMKNHEASIVYKHIYEDLQNVEFYTNVPCLIYIFSGLETFTDSDDTDLVLTDHEMLLLPRNQYLISDFTKNDGPLRSYLFFFDNLVIDEFLGSISMSKEPASLNPLKLTKNLTIQKYVEALHAVYGEDSGETSLLRIKLLELLHLLHHTTNQNELLSFLKGAANLPGKRSIKHIMKQHCLSNLTVADFAQMTGRSLSSFNRDFRRLYDTSPKQWLTDTRLEHARKLLQNSNRSVTDIAYEIGYENTSHFISLYKEKYGNTPKRERQNITD